MLLQERECLLFLLLQSTAALAQKAPTQENCCVSQERFTFAFMLFGVSLFRIS
jgi:hypothetical protein